MVEKLEKAEIKLRRTVSVGVCVCVCVGLCIVFHAPVRCSGPEI